jgi:pseudouridine synthase
MAGGFGLHVLMNKPPLCLCSTVDSQPTAARRTKKQQQRALAGGGGGFPPDAPVGAQPAVPDGTSPRRLTVVDVLRANGIDPARTSAVGRLDFESSGALLFTSDGVLNRAVKAPQAGCDKVYEVNVAGRWGADDGVIRRLAEPMHFPAAEGEPGFTSSPAQVRVLGQRELRGEERELDPWPWPPHGGWSTVLEFTLHEGRNRQIRRLCGRSRVWAHALSR